MKLDEIGDAEVERAMEKVKSGRATDEVTNDNDNA